MFCTNANAALVVKKEMIENGMTSGEKNSCQQEMSVAIKKIKENKAADESREYLAEYMKELDVEKVEKRRGLMNGILNCSGYPKRVER